MFNVIVIECPAKDGTNGMPKHLLLFRHVNLLGPEYRLRLRSCGSAAVEGDCPHDCPFRRTGRKYPFPPRPPVEQDGQKNTPANHGKCRGVLWVGLQTMVIRPRFRRDLKLFSGKTGNLHGFEGIFGDIRGVSGDLKNRGKRRFFSNRAEFRGETSGIPGISPIRESAESPT